MNAALQSLSNCPQLTRFMLDCHSFIRKPGIARSYCRLIKEIWDNRRPSYVVPTGIAHGIKSIFPLFRGYTQQDAQEFLRCFLDQLHEELKESHFSDGQCLAHGSRFSTLHNTNKIYADITTNDDNLTNNRNSDSESDSDADYETCDSGLSSEKSTFGGEDENDLNVSTEQMTVESTNQMDVSHSGNQSPAPTIGSSIESTANPTINSMNVCDESHSPGTHCRPQSPSVQSVPSVPSMSPKKSAEKCRTRVTAYRSIISDIFDGRILSSVQCLKCDNVSTTRETFQDLSLPIPSREQLIMLKTTTATFAQPVFKWWSPTDQ